MTHKREGEGVSFRDLAALVAMHALISQEGSTPGSDSTPKTVAAGAYAFASAMLKAREALHGEGET